MGKSQFEEAREIIDRISILQSFVDGHRLGANEEQEMKALFGRPHTNQPGFWYSPLPEEYNEVTKKKLLRVKDELIDMVEKEIQLLQAKFKSL
ncbi:MAG TPA: hypothetical protein VEB40_00930 [Flavipsychrobacter sp.]|nr:hypothetical protein [Flavipsychrobacter sp.]